MACYLLSAGRPDPIETTRVKIGFAENVRSRVRMLQAGHWDRLHIVRTWPDGTVKTEAWLHQQFPKLRIARDWFWFDALMLTINTPEFRDDMTLIRSKPGMMSKVAKALGISRQAVSLWDKVPAERLPEVERVTGIARHDLRPDICPPPSDAPQLQAAGVG